MNQASATLEAGTDIEALPPVPEKAPLVIPPKPDYDPEVEKVKLFDRIRKVRTSTTEKIREKTQDWKEQADAQEAAEAERAPKEIERTEAEAGVVNARELFFPLLGCMTGGAEACAPVFPTGLEPAPWSTEGSSGSGAVRGIPDAAKRA